MPDGFGPNFADLWAHYDRATSSWKMSQDCLPLTEDTHSVRSSVSWPISGITVNGRCYPLPMWVRPISGSACGWWPTPTARDWKDGGYCPNVEVNGLLGRAVWTPLESATHRGALNPTWVEWLMGFPDGWTDLED